MQGESWEEFCEAESPAQEATASSFHFLKANPSITQGWGYSIQGQEPKTQQERSVGRTAQCVTLTQPYCVSHHSPSRQLLHPNESKPQGQVCSLGMAESSIPRWQPPWVTSRKIFYKTLNKGEDSGTSLVGTFLRLALRRVLFRRA